MESTRTSEDLDHKPQEKPDSCHTSSTCQFGVSSHLHRGDTKCSGHTPEQVRRTNDAPLSEASRVAVERPEWLHEILSPNKTTRHHDTTRGWSVLDQTVRAMDTQKVLDYKEDIDNILVFVCLHTIY